MRLLDLFGASGIIADGYAAAGWEVTCVDVDPAALRHNPHETVERDALDVLADPAYLSRFDAIHASPPCWRFTRGNAAGDQSERHPDLLTPTLAALRAQPLPWVVENVPGAPMPGALVLCGSEFGLSAVDTDGRRVTLRRHRLFLSSVPLWGAGGCTCAADRAAGRIAGVYGGARADPVEARTVRRGGYAVRDRLVAAALLGVTRPDPPPMRYLQLSVPPAYGRHVGEQLIEHVTRERKASA